ncbi:uncharacterized protein N7498_008519 [Penicillium cinerascens]|uniref:Uncharacterized protein n=1 Tax=Penicillium cinerascens TaxID=70096 RepID=A0A9W9JFI9_9EURO|nr:uncharacterized protein N7498_008519 [Penicillium cinerascens]KAJ5195081.1 hypothetical protein N7498_008519 [Penicillium cinerascens]
MRQITAWPPAVACYSMLAPALRCAVGGPRTLEKGKRRPVRAMWGIALIGEIVDRNPGGFFDMKEYEGAAWPWGLDWPVGRDGHAEMMGNGLGGRV